MISLALFLITEKFLWLLNLKISGINSFPLIINSSFNYFDKAFVFHFLKSSDHGFNS